MTEDVDMRTSWEVLTAPTAVWRYAHFPVATFSSTLAHADDDTWIPALMVLLRDDSILKFLNWLDGGEASNRFTLLKTELEERTDPISSDLRKHAYYVMELMMSSFFRNDTGKKGGLSLVPLQAKPARPSRRKVSMASVKLEGSAAYIMYAQADGQMKFMDLCPYIKPQYRSASADRMEFEIDLQTRLSLSKEFANTLAAGQRVVGSHMLDMLRTRGETDRSVPLCLPFSVDYFVRKDRVTALEIHSPARGIELMFHGFRPFVKSTEGFPLESLVRASLQMFECSRRALPRKIMIVNPNATSQFLAVEAGGLATAFAESAGGHRVILREGSARKLIASLEQEHPDAIVFADFPESDSLNGLMGDQWRVPPISVSGHLADDDKLRNQLLDVGVDAPRGLLVSQGSELNIPSLRESLGKWVVAKPLKHRPWWSEKKIKARFFNLSWEYSSEKLRKYVCKTDSVLQELVQDSVDTHGHFGEIRVFSCLLCPSLDCASSSH